MGFNRIEEIRVSKGLSRKALAETIQKSPLTIWRYENDKSAITDTVLRQIARALDVRMADLIADEEEVPMYTGEEK
jgi:transcriptional regulator with XRE-family HTH domain